MPRATWWKAFYANEREALGDRKLEQMRLLAPPISLSRHGAIIFPHAKLSASGQFIAAAAHAVVESGCDTVLALGVLHLGEQRGDASLRGIHGSGAPCDKGIWREEFSLDNFEAMLGIAARLAGKRMPELIARYPFLTGEHPESLPGFDELVTLAEQGAAIVATADMVHRGAGYGTPMGMRLDREGPEAKALAKREVEAQLSTLSRKDFAGFLSQCETARSDFRDAGPVLAALRPSASASKIVGITLVKYADVLEAEEPTWVAAALAEYG